VSIEKIIAWIKSLDTDIEDTLEHVLEIERIVRSEHLQDTPGSQRLSAKIRKLRQPIYESGRTAIISDIHGNDKALSVVLEDIKKNSCDRVICLGDIVDGGNGNDEVIDLLRAMNIPIVQGNHDAINAVTLSPERDQFLKELPTEIEEGDLFFTHISPRACNRLIDNIEAWNVFNETDHRLIFVGHLHVPAIFGSESSDYGTAQSLDFDYDAPFELKHDQRYIICPGAVGYGRDHLQKIRYGIYDHDKSSIEIRALDGPLLNF
jgi:predicted phosphodiesterase